MNIVEKLLKMDAGKIEIPSKVITIQSRKLKQPLDFPCKALDPEKYAEIQEGALELRKGDVKKINMYKMKTLIIIEGCPEVFKNEELQKHFGSPTPKELIKRLLLSGEIDDLYNGINELSGYEKDDEDKDKQEEEIKN
ncbi:phage tail assembly chaperone [Desulfosporosinus sp. SB140]|uniref:phage tail assembly chaperone n=1 Tax=Desulfosporosinus paludis TaxID=3115649 RepID=UPI00388E3738